LSEKVVITGLLVYFTVVLTGPGSSKSFYTIR